MKKVFFLLVSCCLFTYLIARQVDKKNVRVYKKKRPTSEPFISGDTFRSFCNFIVDETHQPFDPEQVKTGDTIFVSAGFPPGNLKRFFSEYHPKIKYPYILVTHNGDSNVPKDYMHYLEDDKIFAWFGQNINIGHPKFIPIPIGLENRHIGRGHYDVVVDLREKGIWNNPKKHLIYANFKVGTNVKVRKPIADIFRTKSFCYFSKTSTKPVREFLTDIYNSKFVISPHGNGLDCHRTWEALYLGAFPIVKKSTLDPLYEGLPVVIVNDWHEITQDFLYKKYKELKNKEYNWKKLDFQYWADLITQYQQQCIDTN